MKLRKIDRWITDLTEGFTSANSKLSQVADLDLTLGKKLDRVTEGLEKLTAFSTRAGQRIEAVGTKLEALATLPMQTEQKINRLADSSDATNAKIDRLADLSTRAEQKVDRLAGKIDKFADASTATNAKIDRLVDVILQREGGSV